MKQLPCIALAIASLAPLSSLQAQPTNFGLAFNVLVPSGQFRESVYPPYGDVSVRQVEGYDVGVGGQFTMSFPVHRNLAFRIGIGGTATGGTNTASGYDTINLRHTMFQLSGEWQFFFSDAYRHRGTYFAAGISGDFESFARSFDDNWSSSKWNSDLDVTRKSRLGGIISFGHTFHGSFLNFTTEFSYHATLTSKDFDRGEPPAADFLRINFGFVF